jgi:hypothetical protein
VGVYRAYIKVQGYNKSHAIWREIVALLWPDKLYPASGSPKWVEVQGGEDWDEGLGGYTSWTGAFNAVHEAQMLCKPRPGHEIDVSTGEDEGDASDEQP